MHEEPTTSFLLGSFASYAQFCSAAFGWEDQTSCYWRYYAKYGADPSSEARTGTDFALIIECVGRSPRVALFQAKSEKSVSRGSFSVHQLRERKSGLPGLSTVPAKLPSPTWEPQFLRFLRHAKRIGRRATGKRVVFNDIHWAHYLVYGSETMKCLSINQLGKVDKHYQAQNKGVKYSDPGRIALIDYAPRNFISLLTMGATPTSRGLDLTGWLEIDADQVEAMKNSLLSFCDVHVATYGPAPEPEPSSDGHNSPKPPDETPKSLLDLFREETAPEKFREELMRMRPNFLEQPETVPETKPEREQEPEPDPEPAPAPEPEPKAPGGQPRGPSHRSRSGHGRH